MDRIEQICEILNKYDKYLQKELKEQTEKNVALYEHWIECAYDVEKMLKEFGELKKKRKILELPCAVGDPVWKVNNGEILRCVVSTIKIEEYGVFFCNSTHICKLNDFGKTVFASEKEAVEAAILKEMNE